MTQINILKQKAQAFNTEVYALYLSTRDTTVKWYMRFIIAFVIGYGISPIDLIPDFTAVFGFLDDIVIVAAGVSLAYHLLSNKVLGRARIQAYEDFNSHTNSAVIAYRIVSYAWILAASLVAVFLYKIIYMSMV